VKKKGFLRNAREQGRTQDEAHFKDLKIETSDARHVLMFYAE
jgi:hypothetical protein